MKKGGQIPKGAKGWYATEMNTWSKEKMRQVLQQYGKQGLTPNTYAWLVARVGEQKPQTKQSTSSKPTPGGKPATKQLNIQKSTPALTHDSITQSSDSTAVRTVAPEVEAKPVVSAAKTAGSTAMQKASASYQQAIRNYEAMTGKKYSRKDVSDQELAQQYSEAAVRKLQMQYGLTGSAVDGKWGSKTANAKRTYEATVSEADKKLAAELRVTPEYLAIMPQKEREERIAGLEAMKAGGGQQSNWLQRGLAGYYNRSGLMIIPHIAENLYNGKGFEASVKDALLTPNVARLRDWNDAYQTVKSGVTNLVRKVKGEEPLPSFEREEIVPLKTAVGANGKVYFTGEADWRNSSINNPTRELGYSLANVGGASIKGVDRIKFGLADWLGGHIADSETTDPQYGTGAIVTDGYTARIRNSGPYATTKTTAFTDSNHRTRIDGQHEGNFVRSLMFPGSGWLEYATPEAMSLRGQAGYNTPSLPVMQMDSKEQGKEFNFSENYFNWMMNHNNGKAGGFAGIARGGGDELTGNSMRLFPTEGQKTGQILVTDTYDFGKDSNWGGDVLHNMMYSGAHAISGVPTRLADSRPFSYGGSKPTDDDIRSIRSTVNPKEGQSYEDALDEMLKQIWPNNEATRKSVKARVLEDRKHFQDMIGSADNGSYEGKENARSATTTSSGYQFTAPGGIDPSLGAFRNGGYFHYFK